MMYLMFGILQGTITHAMHLRDKEEREKATQDLLHRGQGVMRLNADGGLTHIPVDQIYSQQPVSPPTHRLSMPSKPAHDLTLAEAVDHIYYGASCETCRSVRRIDLNRMLAEMGPDALVRDIRPRLACAKCGGKEIISVTLWKAATTSHLLMADWK